MHDNGMLSEWKVGNPTFIFVGCQPRQTTNTWFGPRDDHFNPCFFFNRLNRPPPRQNFQRIYKKNRLCVIHNNANPEYVCTDIRSRRGGVYRWITHSFYIHHYKEFSTSWLTNDFLFSQKAVVLDIK